MSSRNPVFQRFIKSYSQLPRAVEDILQVPSSKRASSARRRKAPTYLKGVAHDGNYYRLKIPQRMSKLPAIPKLPKGTPMPKPLSPPPKPPETVAQLPGYRRQFAQWFRDNLPVMVLNFGSLCTLLAFTRSDVLELRSLAITGQVCFVAYQLKQKMVLWPSVMWSSLFATVNAYNIHHIIEERHSTVRMSDAQERVFVDFFMPHGVTPMQFSRIDEKARRFKMKKGQILIRKGDKLDHVYLIIEGSTQAHILGRRLTAASTNEETRGGQKEGGDSGAWAGEMAFLKQFWEKEQGHIPQPTAGKTTEAANGLNSKSKSRKLGGETLETAFYTVLAAEDCTVMSWSHADMEELMESSVDLRAALTRAMSSALVGKVVNLTISRAQHEKVPWLAWLTAGKTRDGSSVEVRQEELRLAEDRT
ncbi:Popeye conserved region protein [Nitzschia inconspicua]|uniref:Popeye conserved region protein n=1 Tax=Nitzschia inconspicua TaxID=303405 RepID=A0A9K3PV75_9STRA|nr:Popeye conserved region protein [Nitzschia inconspicua]